MSKWTSKIEGKRVLGDIMIKKTKCEGRLVNESTALIEKNECFCERLQKHGL